MPKPTLTTEQFVTRAKTVHGDRYSYELVDYQGAHTKVKIICKEHGSFEQKSSNHLSNHGCPHCAYESKAATAKSEFATKANLIHNDKYDYSLVDYKNSKAKVKIICKHHGIYEQIPNHHLRGSGCPICSLSESGFTRTNFKDKCIKNNNSKGILYILECWSDNERFVKIGITSTSVKKRYNTKSHMPYEYTVLHEIAGSPEFIYDLETLLHRKSKNYKYTPNIPFKGSSTECFEANPIYLDKLNTYLDFNITKQGEINDSRK